MATKLGVVLVHGAWHQPWHFENVRSELEAAGYTVEVPALPSVGSKAIENAQAKDVAAVKQAISNITSSGKDVVVMMHSYGGVVGSEAVAEFHEELKSHTLSSQQGRIVHLLYISAMIVEKGKQLEANPDPHKLEFQDGLAYHLEPMERFYNTTDPAIAQQCVDKLQPHTLEAFVTLTKHNGWADCGFPVTHIACDRDMALKYDPVQLMFIKRFQEADVKDFKVERVNTDHTPWLSSKEEFFRIVWDVLGRASS